MSNSKFNFKFFIKNSLNYLFFHSYGPNFQQKEDDSQINPQIFEEKIKELQLLEVKKSCLSLINAFIERDFIQFIHPGRPHNPKFREARKIKPKSPRIHKSKFLLSSSSSSSSSCHSSKQTLFLIHHQDAVFESKSAALYPETDITFTELLTCLDRAGISEVKSFTIAQYEDIHSIHHNIHTMETNPNLIMFIFDHDLHPIHFG